MKKTLISSALGLALGGAMLAAPAQAVEFDRIASSAPVPIGAASWDYDDDDDWDDDDDDDRWERRRDRDRYYGRGDRRGRYYGEPVYRDTRVWRGRDGRVHCRKRDGTTGLIVGGALGAILGREIDSRGDRSLGTILGAAGGALLGREVTRGRCR